MQVSPELIGTLPSKRCGVTSVLHRRARTLQEDIRTRPPAHRRAAPTEPRTRARIPRHAVTRHDAAALPRARAHGRRHQRVHELGIGCGRAPVPPAASSRAATRTRRSDLHASRIRLSWHPSRCSALIFSGTSSLASSVRRRQTARSPGATVVLPGPAHR